MKSYMFLSGVCAVALLSACGGGAASNTTMPRASLQGHTLKATATTPPTVSFVVTPSPAGSGPTITVVQYQLAANNQAETLEPITIAPDKTLWGGAGGDPGVPSNQNALGYLQGDTFVVVPLGNNNSTIYFATTPNGRVWNAPIGGDAIVYAQKGFAQAEPPGGFGSGKFGPGAVRDIARGPDGNLWFVATKDVNSTNAVTWFGVINQNATSPGQVTDFYPPAHSGQAGTTDELWTIGPGPNKEVWVGGTIAAFGPNVWGFYRYTSTGRLLGRIRTTARSINTPLVGAGNSEWFEDSASATIDNVTSSGALRVFPTRGGGMDGGFSEGSDGALWFSENPGGIGRITASGQVAQYTLPYSYYQGAGPFGLVGPSNCVCETPMWETSGIGPAKILIH